MRHRAGRRAGVTGVTKTKFVIGGTFPLSGPAAYYAPIPVGMKVYFTYINTRRGADHKRGVVRQADRLEVLRRRIQPREHGAADAQARRGGQGLRHLRRARHRAAAGRGRLHERPQGAAAARLDRRDRVRQPGTRRSRTRSAGSRTTSPRAGSTASTPRRTGRRRRSPSSTRTTTTARTTSRASRAGLGAKASNIVTTQGFGATDASVASAGRGGPPVGRRGGRDLRDAEPDGEDLRDDEGAQVQARAGDPQLGLGERLRHGPRARQLRRDDTRRHDQHRVSAELERPEVREQRVREALQGADGEVGAERGPEEHVLLLRLREGLRRREAARRRRARIRPARSFSTPPGT